MRFLVTGGAGFIGSHIVERLISENHEVFVIYNFSTGGKENISHLLHDIVLHEGDIRDYNLVESTVRNVDYILHHAALSSVPKSMDDPVATNEINVNGTLNILEAARKFQIKKVVFASSASIYGDDPELPKKESMVPAPLSPYAYTKLVGENYCKMYSELYGLGTVSFRYFNVFGPRQNPNSEYAAVIPKFIDSFLNDNQPTIYGDGKQTRDFIFIDDIVDANLKAVEMNSSSGVVFNCASGVTITINDLTHLINKILSKNLSPIYKGVRKGDIKHSFADVNLIQKKLKFKIKNTLEEGLTKTIESYQ